MGGITQTDFGYTGQRALDDGDGTTQNPGMGGLMDYHARFYSPALGRFLQPDSIIPNAANPQAFNRYSYVMNSPILYNDPTGHRNCEEDGYNCDATSSGGNGGNHNDDEDNPTPIEKDLTSDGGDKPQDSPMPVEGTDCNENANCDENAVQDFSSTSISRDQVELAIAFVVLTAVIVVIAAPIIAGGLAATMAAAGSSALVLAMMGAGVTGAGFTGVGAIIAGVAGGVAIIGGALLGAMNEVDDMNGW